MLARSAVRPVLLTAAVVVAAGGLAGCRIEPLNSTVAAAQATGQGGVPAAHADLRDVTVHGAQAPGAQAPTVTVPVPFAVASTRRLVVRQGSGDTVREGQRLVMRYVGVNGTDGRPFDSEWTTQGRELMVDDGTLPGLVKALDGVTVGSQVLVAIPPKDGYGAAGKPRLGIRPTDTMVVLADVLSCQDVLTRAAGRVVAPAAGLPRVTRAADGEPDVARPQGSPPASLVAQDLIAGTGPVVSRGQAVTVRYKAVVWRTGRVFDSTWTSSASPTFVLGRGQTLAGWDALIGRHVGSQVLLVIPPDLGYGARGKPEFGVGGADTVVFVVDVLDARS